MEPLPEPVLTINIHDKAASFLVKYASIIPSSDATWTEVQHVLSGTVTFSYFVAESVVKGCSRSVAKLVPLDVKESMACWSLIKYITETALLPFIQVGSAGLYLLVENHQLSISALPVGILNNALLTGATPRKKRPYSSVDEEPPQKRRRVNEPSSYEQALLIVQRAIPFDTTYWSILSVNRSLHSEGVERAISLSTNATSTKVLAAILPSLVVRCRTLAIETDVNSLRQLAKIVELAASSDHNYYHRLSSTFVSEEVSRLPLALHGKRQSVRENATKFVRLLFAMAHRLRPDVEISSMFSTLTATQAFPYLTMLDSGGFELLLHLMPVSLRNVHTLRSSLIAAKAIQCGNTILALHMVTRYPASISFSLTFYFALCYVRPTPMSMASHLLDYGLPFTDPFIMQFLVQRKMFDLFDLLLERGHPFCASPLLDKLAQADQWERISLVGKKAPTQSVNYQFSDGTIHRIHQLPGPREQAFDSLYTSFERAMAAIPNVPAVQLGKEPPPVTNNPPPPSNPKQTPPLPGSNVPPSGLKIPPPFSPKTPSSVTVSYAFY